MDLSQQEAQFRRNLKVQQSLSQGMSEARAAGSRHANFYIHEIIKALKTADVPLSLEDIKNLVGIDLSTNKDLLGRICQSDRVCLRNGSLFYEPIYKIKSKEDVLEIIKKQSPLTGLNYEDLKSYPGAEDAIKDFSKAKLIFSVKCRDDGPRVLFYNELQNQEKLPDEFCQLWSGVPVSESFEELRASLDINKLRSNITLARKASAEDVRPPPPKKARKPFRRIKITNDYLEGIDLSIDPSIGM